VFVSLLAVDWSHRVCEVSNNYFCNDNSFIRLKNCERFWILVEFVCIWTTVMLSGNNVTAPLNPKVPVCVCPSPNLFTVTVTKNYKRNELFGLSLILLSVSSWLCAFLSRLVARWGKRGKPGCRFRGTAPWSYQVLALEAGRTLDLLDVSTNSVPLTTKKCHKAPPGEGVLLCSDYIGMQRGIGYSFEVPDP